MELVPYPGIDTLPRHLWKKIYTEEEKAQRRERNKKYAEQRRAENAPQPPKPLTMPVEMKAKLLATAGQSAAGFAASPNQTPDEKQQILNIYRKSVEMTLATGVQYSVDHIYPLSGDKYGVCGLHVAANLQVITLLENMQKNNLPHESWIDYAGFLGPAPEVPGHGRGAVAQAND